MFCPKCSQQQSSESVRFCSRCGFPLEIVKELLLTDGALVWPEAETRMSRRSARNRGIRQGVMLMLLTALIVPVSVLLSKLGLLPKEFVALAAIFCAIGGFLRLVYALMLEEGAQNKKPATAPPAYNAPPPSAQFRQGHAGASALPPQQSRPASDFYSGRRIETADMAQPPSVTENTTRLLDNTPDD